MNVHERERLFPTPPDWNDRMHDYARRAYRQLEDVSGHRGDLPSFEDGVRVLTLIADDVAGDLAAEAADRTASLEARLAAAEAQRDALLVAAKAALPYFNSDISANPSWAKQGRGIAMRMLKDAIRGPAGEVE